MDVIFIKWVDTIGDPEQGWKGDEDTNEFFEREDNVAEEVGFVWEETDDYLCLIGSWMPGEVPLTRNRTKIPKKWILERTVSDEGQIKLRLMKTCQHEGCSFPIWSHGYCKFHQRDRADYKPYKFKQREPTGEMDVFKAIWDERPHVSEISGKPLDKYEGTEFFPNLFMHILDKKNYPKYRLE